MLISGKKEIKLLSAEPVWSVFTGRSSHSREVVLITVLAEQWAGDPVCVELFKQACKLGRTLDHPNILQAIAYDMADQVHCCFFRHFDGVPLSVILRATGAMPEDLACQIFRQICKALRYAHMHGILHGALTIDCIYVNKGMEMRLMHFGNSGLVQRLLRNSEICRYYAPSLAPELHQNAICDVRSEMYAAGVIFHQMLTAKLPGEVPQAILSEKISAPVRAILERSIHPDADARFLNFSELLADLQPEPETALPVQPVRRPFSLHPYLILLKDRYPWLELMSHTVGAKRQLIFAAVIAFAVIFIALCVLLISDMGSKTTVNEQKYRQFLSWQDSVAQKKKNPQPAEKAETSLPAPQYNILAPKEAGTMLTGNEISCIVRVMADSAPAAAEIYVNDVLQGSSSAASGFPIAHLAPGHSYKISVRKTSYQPWTENYNFSTDTLLQVSLKQIEAGKHIFFQAADFSDRVIVDNHLPSLILPASMDLALGAHELRYVDGNGNPVYETKIRLDESSPDTISFAGSVAGTGQLVIVLTNPQQYGYAFVTIDGGGALTTPLRQNVPAGKHRIRIYREGFNAFPADTVIYIYADREAALPVRLTLNAAAR